MGAVLRWLLSLGLNAVWATMPLGTLAANLIGAYLVGFLMSLLEAHAGMSAEWKLFLITGFLGGLTTFSTFSLEVYELLVEGRFTVALAYMAATLFGCLLALAVGITAARWVMGH